MVNLFNNVINLGYHIFGVFGALGDFFVQPISSVLNEVASDGSLVIGWWYSYTDFFGNVVDLSITSQSILFYPLSLLLNTCETVLVGFGISNPCVYLAPIVIGVFALLIGLLVKILTAVIGS